MQKYMVIMMRNIRLDASLLRHIDDKIDADNKSKMNLFKKSLKYLKPSCIEFLILLFIGLMLLLLLLQISWISIDVVNNIIVTFNSCLYTIVTIIITAYAIFQALIGKKMIEILYTYKDNEGKNYLFEGYQLHFFGVVVIYIITIVFSLLFYSMNILFKEYNFFSKDFIALGISVYIVWSMYLIIEVIACVHDLYNIISINALEKILYEDS